jgi:hypothetical protein
MSEDLLSKAKKQSDIDKYNADIAASTLVLIRLKNLVPDNLQGYDSRNANDELAKIVRCKYSVQVTGIPLKKHLILPLSRW